MKDEVCTPEELPAKIEYWVKDQIRVMDVGCRKAVQESAKECVEYLKSSSPRRTGVYAKSWTADMKTDELGHYVAIIHNVKRYRLTHLLEHGHEGPHPAPAKPHIEAAAVRAEKDLMDRMSK